MGGVSTLGKNLSQTNPARLVSHGTGSGNAIGSAMPPYPYQSGTSIAADPLSNLGSVYLDPQYYGNFEHSVNLADMKMEATINFMMDGTPFRVFMSKSLISTENAKEERDFLQGWMSSAFSDPLCFARHAIGLLDKAAEKGWEFNPKSKENLEIMLMEKQLG